MPSLSYISLMSLSDVVDRWKAFI